jgi:hypothetical protein
MEPDLVFPDYTSTSFPVNCLAKKFLKYNFPVQPGLEIPDYKNETISALGGD